MSWTDVIIFAAGCIASGYIAGVIHEYHRRTPHEVSKVFLLAILTVFVAFCYFNFKLHLT